jgi:hypothetical protein
MEQKSETKPFLSENLIDYCIDPTDFSKLEKLSNKECRQILPFLARIWVRSSIDSEDDYPQYKLAILDKIRLFEDTNKICKYLKSDFSQIYEDVIKHLSTRKKTQTLSTYSYNQFESSNEKSKILMIANILLNGNIRVNLI